LELIRRFSVNVDIENIDVPGLKDPKDSFLFALAKETDANFILTGDKHLLKLRQYGNAVIISYSEFMKLYYSQSLEG
jgi:predicted nucleic acid-binding protein